jgi:predicted Zn-ribbon and HTH transcriptional regulator
MESKVTVEVVKNKCLRCGWEWVPRLEDPRLCPHCKTAYWDVPKGEKIDKQLDKVNDV